MASWFTSDHHFGHANIIRICGRPFATVDEMDEAMIERWNSVVGTDDEVWHLGDFAYRCGPNRLSDIFRSLKGRALYLVRGNHDRRRTLELPWASVRDYVEIDIDGRTIVLSHYAFRVWNKSHFGSWNLFGHSHGKLEAIQNSCDVSVDVWDFRPVSLEQIGNRIRVAGNLA